jgi:hypothetical protein
MRTSAGALATALLAFLLAGWPLALAAQPLPPARPKAPVAEHPAPQPRPQFEAKPAPVDPGPGKTPEPAATAEVVNKCIGALQAMGADVQSTQAGQRGACLVGAPVRLGSPARKGRAAAERPRSRRNWRRWRDMGFWFAVRCLRLVVCGSLRGRGGGAVCDG